MTAITVVGNVGRAELKFTPSGRALLTFTVAHTRRRYDKSTGQWADAGTDWYRCDLWGEKAEAAVDTVVKGARVIAAGELESRTYDAASGKSTAWEVRVTDVGVVARAGRTTPTADPWATPGPADDVAPF